MINWKKAILLNSDVGGFSRIPSYSWTDVIFPSGLLPLVPDSLTANSAPSHDSIVDLPLEIQIRDYKTFLFKCRTSFRYGCETSRGEKGRYGISMDLTFERTHKSIYRLSHSGPS